MEQLKIISVAVGLVIALVSFIGGIIFVSTYFGNKAEDAKLARSIECRQSGGQMSYESYSWVCK